MILNFLSFFYHSTSTTSIHISFTLSRPPRQHPSVLTMCNINTYHLYESSLCKLPQCRRSEFSYLTFSRQVFPYFLHQFLLETHPEQPKQQKYGGESYIKHNSVLVF